jgi:hypothetical protein
MKMTGAEWRAFYTSGWPEGYVWSEESVLPDGRDIDDKPPADDEVFSVPADWGMYREDEECPVHAKDKGHGMDVRSMVRAWRKAQENAVVVVLVPRAQEAEARTLFAERNWGVL